MNNKPPLITIGMTCFNAEETIGRAIESAKSQDYPNFEILIIDDTSSDASHQVIKDSIKGMENARFIPHEINTGFAGALNDIIKNAEGEFIAIFDDDDISLPERIRTQYERIKKYEEDFETQKILCHVARIQVFENGMERYEQTLGTQDGLAPNGIDVAKRILYGDLSRHGNNIVGSCANCARMARTDIFRDLGGFDDSIRRGEDTDFSIRFALDGGHFVGIDTPLVHQTMTTGEEKTLDKEYDVEMTFTKKYKNFLEKTGWYDFAIKWLDIRYAAYRQQKIRFFCLLSKIFLQYPLKTCKKLLWSLPAHDTRQSFKKWHLGKLNRDTKAA